MEISTEKEKRVIFTSHGISNVGMTPNQWRSITERFYFYFYRKFDIFQEVIGNTILRRQFAGSPSPQ